MRFYMKNKYLKSFIALSALAVTASGLLFIFQYLNSLINQFINLEKVDSPYYYLLYIIFIILISYAESFFLKPPFLKGNLLTLKKFIFSDEKIHWFKGIIVVFIGCLLSFLIGLPLGSEAPSVFMTALLGEGIFHLFKNKTKELEGAYLGAGIGYSLAFLNPLAGFCHYLEEEKLHVTFKNIIKPVYILILSFALLLLWRYLSGIEMFYHYEVFDSSLTFFAEPSELYLCILVPFFALISAYLFKSAVITLHKCGPKNIKAYYIISTFIAVIFVTLIKFSGHNLLLGSGVELLQDLSSFTTTDIIAFLLVRFLFTSITFNLFYAGGQVIPTIALGALVGNLLVSLLSGYDLSSPIKTVIIITTMLTFYAIVTDTYKTSFCLLFSFGPFYIIAIPMLFSLTLSYIINKHLEILDSISKMILEKEKRELHLSLKQ